jgi:hypothetical protein
MGVTTVWVEGWSYGYIQDVSSSTMADCWPTLPISQESEDALHTPVSSLHYAWIL